LLFKQRALNKTKDDKIGGCDNWETQWPGNWSVATAEELRISHSEAACSTGVNVPASGFNVERLVGETFEFVAVCIASIRRPTADDDDEDRCLAAERLARCCGNWRRFARS
jgi:hypothetical protein